MDALLTCDQLGSFARLGSVALVVVLFFSHSVSAQLGAKPDSTKSANVPAAGTAPSASSQALTPVPSVATEVPSTPVPEQPTAEIRQAATRYDRGLRLYEEGNYRLAAIEFERAYSLVPNYRVLYNIGQVRIQLGNFSRAYHSLRQYLEEGAEQVPEHRQRAVLADLEMLRGRIASLSVSASVADAEVLVDDVVVGRTPLLQPLVLDAGMHRILVRKPGYLVFHDRLELAGDDTYQLEVSLEAAPVSETIVVQSDSRETRRTWMWRLWAATGVLGLGAATTGVMGGIAAGDLADLRAQREVSRSELDSAAGRARSLLLTSDVLSVLTLASGGVAAYLALTDEDTSDVQATALGLQLGPLNLQVTGRF